MAPVRVLVVGHGLIGRQRAAAVAALADRLPVTLAGTVDPVPRDPALHGGAPHHETLEAASPADYDAAVVALPHDLAADVTRSLLRGGTPVLVEKPLGLTGADARELETLAADLSTPSFVGFNYRFLPHVRDLFAAVREGALGTLRSIDMLIGHGGHPGSAEGWKLRPERAGGGVLLDPGVHLLDLMLLLDGGLAPGHVTATRGFWPTGIEEDVAATFEHEALLASVRVSHVRWVNTFRIEVVGEDGYVLLEGRGGNYGAMVSRRGRRWAWHGDDAGRSQRETEQVRDHGAVDASLAEELEAVLLRWTRSGAGGAADGPAPATMREARRVTELCEELYARLR